MTDRRVTPCSGRVAHLSLRDAVDLPLTEGEEAFVLVPIADLLASPAGARDRQLLLGDALTVIDRDLGYVFVQAAKDGYCGWLAEDSVGAGMAPTHWVASPATHLFLEPRVQAKELAALSVGARLTVTGLAGAWAKTPYGFVPSSHLRRIGEWAEDPVSVAESLVGTPYLWGGNTRAGLDCSGLVQIAMNAAGLACSGDSDLQQVLGSDLPHGALMRRGDIIFWKGHVAIVVDGDQLIHANAHTMSVAYERIAAAKARIAAAGGGAVVATRRP